MKTKPDIDTKVKKKVYGEIFKLSIDPRILVDGHLFVEFEKEVEAIETNQRRHSKCTDCDSGT